MIAGKTRYPKRAVPNAFYALAQNQWSAALKANGQTAAADRRLAAYDAKRQAMVAEIGHENRAAQAAKEKP